MPGKFFEIRRWTRDGRFGTSSLTDTKAGVAQLVEQLICNQQVGGSNPFAGSFFKNEIVKREDKESAGFINGFRGDTQAANEDRL